MRWAYLPPDHWWQRLAANVSPLAAFLAIVPFVACALGAALLAAERVELYRKWHVAALILIAAIGVGGYPAGWRLKPGESIRVAGLERIMLNARPVIEAIDRYRSDIGEYPKSLAVLAPKYLPAVPATGNAIYPEYDYRLAGDGWGWTIPHYELFVRTPVGIFNWDQFVYRPEHEYPQEPDGGPVERIGVWAYIHE